MLLVYQNIFYLSTNKIVGISTLSSDEHRIAQTREVECTRIVLSEVMKQGWIVFKLLMYF